MDLKFWISFVVITVVTFIAVHHLKRGREWHPLAMPVLLVTLAIPGYFLYGEFWQPLILLILAGANLVAWQMRRVRM